MRLLATKRSADSDSVSLLAIAECFFAVAAYLFISLYLGTSLPYSTAIAVAPLLLLRTARSTEIALRHYRSLLGPLDRLVDNLPNWPPPGVGRAAYVLLILVPIYLVTLLVFPTYLLAGGLACRIGSTTWCVIRYPLESLKSIPGNWYRQALCTDLTIHPEIVPGEAASGSEFPTFRQLLDLFGDQFNERSWASIFLLLTLLLIGYVPTVLLRLSFKASSFAYAPFVWVTHVSLNSALPIHFRLERVVKSEFEKVRRGLSYFIAAALALKLAFAAHLVSSSELGEQLKNAVLTRILSQVTDWPLWQILLIVESTLTFFLYYFADAASARITAGNPWSEKPVKVIFELLVFSRAALGIITIVIALIFAFMQITTSLRSAAPRAIFHGFEV